MLENVQIEVGSTLDLVDASQWNALSHHDNPFVRYEFLSALETNKCVDPEFGWQAYHILIKDKDDKLIAAAPTYLKSNSYGEFVFDFAWAEAYERSGAHYYPKLICAAPFTPATGPRLLVHKDHDYDTCAETLLAAAIAVTDKQDISSFHWLFNTDKEAALMDKHNYLRRMGCQYIWGNDNYTDFNDFLSHCTSKKRKNLKRERKRVAEQDITLEVFHGSDLVEKDWRKVISFYLDTFNRKWGTPTLNVAFFTEIGKTMGDDIIVVFATHNNKRVACSVMFKGGDTLYGRYWGCHEDFHSLHFETCYYQGIDYCIKHGLKRFEPGAQGEHKIGRGFVPTPTWSSHYIREPGFRSAVAQFLKQETPLMQKRCEELKTAAAFSSRGNKLTVFTMTGLPIPLLSDTDDTTPFPSVDTAMQDPNGLLMAGANLKPERLLNAYHHGIFPWYSEGEPILWWSPNPRCVIWPDELKISRSLRKVIKQQKVQVSHNQAFRSVVEACGAPREESEGTWITQDMIDAYCELSRLGHAESIEVWEDNELVGGLYGVTVGRTFVGESMFSRRSNASKIALVSLAGSGRFEMIDCQLPTDHLMSMGAVNIDRADYIQALTILARSDT